MTDWATVDGLIRDLGAVRVAADAAQTRDDVREVIEQAILEAAEAVAATFEDAASASALRRAESAVRTASEVVAVLGSEIERARALRADGVRLTVRARELLEAASRQRPAPRPHDD